MVWERVNCVAATSVGRYREDLEEAGQAGLSAGHGYLPGIGEQTLESGSKPSAWYISMGRWGGSCIAPLPGPAAGEGLQIGKLMARAGCSRQANNTSGRRSGGQQRGQLPLWAVTHHPRLPEPPEKFWDVLEESWYCNPSSISGFAGEAMAAGRERFSPPWCGAMQ